VIIAVSLLQAKSDNVPSFESHSGGDFVIVIS